MPVTRIPALHGHPYPRRFRQRTVCHWAVLRHHQISALRRPDIRDKRHIPALTAAVDTGGDCTGSG
ncbi:hypothetical protein, partial [Escherichia coli]|uniref:hypothetical protein n=1 Tax=Escherichia coli TaxID=562 RepID=UPI001BB02B34